MKALPIEIITRDTQTEKYLWPVIDYSRTLQQALLESDAAAKTAYSGKARVASLLIASAQSIADYQASAHDPGSVPMPQHKLTMLGVTPAGREAAINAINAFLTTRYTAGTFGQSDVIRLTRDASATAQSAQFSARVGDGTSDYAVAINPTRIDAVPINDSDVDQLFAELFVPTPPLFSLSSLVSNIIAAVEARRSNVDANGETQVPSLTQAIHILLVQEAQQAVVMAAGGGASYNALAALDAGYFATGRVVVSEVLIHAATALGGSTGNTGIAGASFM